MAIGFGSAEKGAREELKTVDDLHRMLVSEITEIHQFQERLLREFKEVQDMEHNLKVLEVQVENIRKLSVTKEDLVKKLVGAFLSRDSDIPQCEQYITMIGQVNARLVPLLEHGEHDIKKLILKESHDLYSAEEQNRKAMRTIDGRARELVAEVKMLARKSQSVEQDLQGIANEVEKIKRERNFRPAKKSGPGF